MNANRYPRQYCAIELNIVLIFHMQQLLNNSFKTNSLMLISFHIYFFLSEEPLESFEELVLVWNEPDEQETEELEFLLFRFDELSYRLLRGLQSY